MTVHSHTIAALAVASAVMTGLGMASGAGTLSQDQPPAGQGSTTPVQGRGGDAGQRGAPPEGGRQGRGGRAGGFTQFTRPLAPQDVLVRGKALYETNCASCHASDLRGTADGKNPNLLRSGVALRDQKGELIAARVAKHTPSITLIEADTVAVAEFIHSRPRDDGRAGQSAGTESNQRDAERARRRPEVW